MNPSAVFIFITVMLDSIGLGIVIPVLPDIMRRFVTDEAMVSRNFGLFISLFALMQFFASPLLGRLSDRYGRRPILLVSLLGNALDYLLMAYAPTLGLLFTGRIISGLTGANLTVAAAYIADVSNDKNRSANFGLMSAGFGIGFILGPVIGGLLGSHNPHYPFLAAGCFSFFNFLYGIFVLPESLPIESRRGMSLSQLNPFRSLKHLIRPSVIRPLIVVYFLYQLAGQVHPSSWTLYTEHKFHWSSSEVGLSLTFVGVVQALCQTLLPRFLTPRVGEFRLLFWGALGQSLAFLAFALAPTPGFIYGVILFSAFCWVSQPSLQSLITKQVHKDEQGELQGTLVSLLSLAAIITPIVSTNLFATFSAYFPGAPYIFAATMFFLAWSVVGLVRPKN